MELLYFISGILTVGIAYSIVLLRKNQSNYHDALARLQSHQNISSMRIADLESEIKEAGRLIADVEVNMEKDQYASVSELNKKIEEIAQMTNAINVREAQLDKLVENNFSKTFSEIQQLKKNIKAIGDDQFIR